MLESGCIAAGSENHQHREGLGERGLQTKQGRLRRAAILGRLGTGRPEQGQQLFQAQIAKRLSHAPRALVGNDPRGTVRRSCPRLGVASEARREACGSSSAGALPSPPGRRLRCSDHRLRPVSAPPPGWPTSRRTRPVSRVRSPTQAAAAHRRPHLGQEPELAYSGSAAKPTKIGSCAASAAFSIGSVHLIALGLARSASVITSEVGSE